jgi:hypothetical protein
MMARATYVYGSKEYLRVEVTQAFGTLSTTDYTAALALSAIDAVFVAASATWATATWETVDGRHYLKVLLTTGLSPAVGKYKVYAKLTGATEVPVIACVGTVTIA